jgi:hypothetical protein
MKARLLVVLSLVTGCSVYMEATRPAPVDLSKFQLGEERYSVIEQLGAPETTEASGANSCDLYRLYTTGHGTFRKVATIVGEGATDVVFSASRDPVVRGTGSHQRQKNSCLVLLQKQEAIECKCRK